MRIRQFLPHLLALAAMAQVPAPGTEIPKLRGETLSGRKIVVPDDAAGKVTLLVVSATKKAGDLSGPWRERFSADFGRDPNATYYVAALLQGAPGMVRGMIRSAMRGGTPATEQSHVLTTASDDAVWKRYLALADENLPAVLLLDGTGRVRWSWNGAFDAGRYESLKGVVAQLLRTPGSNK